MPLSYSLLQPTAPGYYWRKDPNWGWEVVSVFMDARTRLMWLPFGKEIGRAQMLFYQGEKDCEDAEWSQAILPPDDLVSEPKERP